MLLEIENSDELNKWLNEKRKAGQDVYATKRLPPEGATYSDGQLIQRSVNDAWVSMQTGERFHIKYKGE